MITQKKKKKTEVEHKTNRIMSFVRLGKRGKPSPTPFPQVKTKQKTEQSG